VFDLLLNLAVHGELLQPAPPACDDGDDGSEEGEGGELGTAAGPGDEWRSTVTSELRASLAAGIDGYGRGGAGAGAESPPSTQLHWGGGGQARGQPGVDGTAAAGGAEEWPPLPRRLPPGCSARDLELERLRQWLRLLLFRLLDVLRLVEAPAEGAWAAAASCLAALVTYDGHVARAYVQELPLPAAAALLAAAAAHSWPDGLRCWLATLAANLLYTSPLGDAPPPASPGRRAPSWWGAARLDPGRLAAFGGAAAVVRRYIEAPTARARRALFCVLLEYVVGGEADGGAGGGGGWAPPAVAPSRRAHGSEVAALGAALLHMRAAETLHPLFAAGASGFGGRMAAAVVAQMAAVQEATPTRITQAPPDFVAECLGCLEAMATGGAAPSAVLEAPLRLAVGAVGGAAGAGGGGEEEERAAWAVLAGGLAGAEDAPAAAAWLLRLLLAAAEVEVEACRAAGRRPGSLLPSPGGAAAAGAPPPLLPPADLPLAPQPALQQLLADALLAGGAAPEALAAAVCSLVDHLLLRCAGEAWDAAAGGPGREPAPWGTGAAPQQRMPGGHGRQDSFDSLRAGGRWGGVDPARAAVASLAAAAEWLQRAPAGRRRAAASLLVAEKLVELLVVRGEADRGLPDAGASASEPAASGNGDGAALHAAAAPQHARAATPPPRPVSAPIPPVEARRTSSEQQQGGTTSPSKGVPMPRLAAAWRRLTAPHGAGRQQRPAPGGVDAAADATPLSAGVPALGGTQVHPAPPPAPAPARPAPAPAAGGTRAQPYPQPPAAPSPLQPEALRQRAKQRKPGEGPSLLELAAEVAARDQAEAAEQRAAAAAAAAAAERRTSAVASFLCGVSGASSAALELVPPALLRALYEELRMDPPGGQAGDADAAARAAAVQAGRPAWDARAAVLTLLLGRCAGEEAGAGLGASAGSSGSGSLRAGQAAAEQAAAGAAALDAAFLADLLDAPDPRVRHVASAFALQQLLRRRPGAHRRGVREVVARAQRSDDEHLLCSPHAQLRAMLELRALPADALA
jgi:hypothetical protein